MPMPPTAEKLILPLKRSGSHGVPPTRTHYDYFSDEKGN